MLEQPIGDIWKREVRFGNFQVARGSETYTGNRSTTHWRAVSVKVKNVDDFSIERFESSPEDFDVDPRSRHARTRLR